MSTSKASNAVGNSIPRSKKSTGLPSEGEYPLLPCPFCGRVARFARVTGGPDRGGLFIECVGCGACTYLRFGCGDDLTSKLVDDWNRRVSPTTDHGAPATGTRWRHVERGTVYDEVCRAELQVSTTLPVEGRTIVVYRGEDGRLWARDRYEFEDGRFERVGGPQIFLGPAVDPEHLTIADYEQVLADKRRLTRELDVAMHGEAGAAKQASLCDLIEPARRLRTAARLAEADRDLAIVEAERLSSALEALRDALIWMRDRDDQNGSLPDPYRAKIDAALAAAPKAGTDGATSP